MGEQRGILVKIPACPTCGRTSFLFAAADWDKDVFRCVCGAEYGEVGRKKAEAAGARWARERETAFMKEFLKR